MLNRYNWANYLDTGGREVATRFEQSLKEWPDPSFPQFVSRLAGAYCPASAVTDKLQVRLEDLVLDREGWAFAGEKGFDTEECLIGLWKIDEEAGEEIGDADNLAFFIDQFPQVTTSLTMAFPDLFIPYYFQFCHNVLNAICNEFGIELPPIPVKRDYFGRFMYYGAVCEALQGFRRREGMTLGELCAFLYDFAPKSLGGTNWAADPNSLPEPTAAFLIGGSAEDLALNGPGDNGIAVWQCSPDAVVGDAVMFYLTSPDSCIASTFRCVSDGFDDPFFWYYRCCYIARREDVSRVSLAQMRTDDMLKSDYRYSGGMVYNDFVWPQPDEALRQEIERRTQSILDVRDTFPEHSLAELYDPDKTPEGLKAAHHALDAAVEAAYGVDFCGDEERIVTCERRAKGAEWAHGFPNRPHERA